MFTRSRAVICNRWMAALGQFLLLDEPENIRTSRSLKQNYEYRSACHIEVFKYGNVF